MKRPSYKAAISIACQLDHDNLSQWALERFPPVVLISKLFGVPAAKVARDAMDNR